MVKKNYLPLAFIFLIGTDFFCVRVVIATADTESKNPGVHIVKLISILAGIKSHSDFWFEHVIGLVFAVFPHRSFYCF
jgi:hypothetical protein